MIRLILKVRAILLIKETGIRAGLHRIEKANQNPMKAFLKIKHTNQANRKKSDKGSSNTTQKITNNTVEKSSSDNSGVIPSNENKF